MQPIVTKQQQQLNELKDIVREHEHSAMKWAKALLEIHETELWKLEAKTWAAFCEAEFGYSKAKSYRWIGAARFIEDRKKAALKDPEIEVPTTLRRARVLASEIRCASETVKKVTAVLKPVMTAKLDTQSSPIHFAKPPAPPRDIRELMGAMEKDMDALLHRQDIPYDALRIIYKLGSELKQARTLLQGVLPGIEEVVSKPRFRKPSLEDVQLFCEKSKINGRDAEWFWNKMEGNGWKNGGKPVVDWQRTLTAWKLAGHLPSQRVVNGSGHLVPKEKTIIQKDMERLSAQVDRLL